MRRCPLVLVGSWGWNTAQLADFYNQEARHKGVMHLGYAADEDLPALYNGARALVFPSHYEGFGLPPVKMLACGGPVLASTAGTLVETVGAHAELIEPLDQDGWQLAMRASLRTTPGSGSCAAAASTSPARIRGSTVRRIPGESIATSWVK